MKLKEFIIILICILAIVHICFTKTKNNYEARQEQQKPAVVEKTVEKQPTIKIRKKAKQLNISTEEYNTAVNEYNGKMAECTGYLKNEQMQKARDCFEYLDETYYDYQFYQDNINALTYNKALIDRNLGNYEKAKSEFEEVIYFEKNNENMVRDAKILINEINETLKYEAEKKRPN